MSDKPRPHLNKEQVYKLNVRHGYFQYGDAQGNVSCEFANDAVAAYMQMCAEASQVAARTGLAPLDMEEHRDALVEQVKELREALTLMIRTHDEPAESLIQESRERRWLDAARAALQATERKTT